MSLTNNWERRHLGGGTNWESRHLGGTANWESRHLGGAANWERRHLGGAVNWESRHLGGSRIRFHLLIRSPGLMFHGAAQGRSCQHGFTAAAPASRTNRRHVSSADAEEFFNEIGMNMTTAITCFFKKCLAVGEIPFKLVRQTAIKTGRETCFCRFHAQMRLWCGLNLKHALQHGHDLERSILVAVNFNRFIFAVKRQERDLLMVP